MPDLGHAGGVQPNCLARPGYTMTTPGDTEAP